MTPPTDAAADLDAAEDAPEGTRDDATADPTDGTDDGAKAEESEREPTPPWTWHLTRVTGLFLAVLVPVHFVAVMIVNDVGATTNLSMDQRLRNITWRSLEWIILLLALAHGFLALRPVIVDSRLRASIKEAAVVAAGVIAVLFALAVSLVLLAPR